jgi:hypothetical protein
MNFEFCRQVFKKRANMKFKENPSSGNRVDLCGKRDGHKEAKSLLSQFCEGDLKSKAQLGNRRYFFSPLSMPLK